MKRRTFLLMSALGALPPRLKAGVFERSNVLTQKRQIAVTGADWSHLRLWYRQPAANWNAAVPIGDGRLAAMVFGGVGSERIQLNEDTICAGENRDRINPEGARKLAEL